MPSAAPRVGFIPTVIPTPRTPPAPPSAAPVATTTEMPTIFIYMPPSAAPAVAPAKPSAAPTALPSFSPDTSLPSRSPTPAVAPAKPSAAPTALPSFSPETSPPSWSPSMSPSAAPGIPSMPPVRPSAAPTTGPSLSPAALPSPPPTLVPSALPSQPPSGPPSTGPSMAPTASPFAVPTLTPTGSPTMPPVASPTFPPTPQPRGTPTASPLLPTMPPVMAPSSEPTNTPTVQPTLGMRQPTPAPTEHPAVQPTSGPSDLRPGPSARPSQAPSQRPTSPRAPLPSGGPSESPRAPTSLPTRLPLPGNGRPSGSPTVAPSRSPSVSPVPPAPPPPPVPSPPPGPPTSSTPMPTPLAPGPITIEVGGKCLEVDVTKVIPGLDLNSLLPSLEGRDAITPEKCDGNDGQNWMFGNGTIELAMRPDLCIGASSDSKNYTARLMACDDVENNNLTFDPVAGTISGNGKCFWVPEGQEGHDGMRIIPCSQGSTRFEVHHVKEESSSSLALAAAAGAAFALAIALCCVVVWLLRRKRQPEDGRDSESYQELLTVGSRPKPCVPKNWQRGQLLGRGSFGSVYMGIRQDGTLMAVKTVQIGSGLDEDQLGALMREVEVMSTLSHEHIVDYYGITYDQDTNELCIYMEYMDGGSLGSFVRKLQEPLREPAAAAYLRQILLGVGYLHSHGVIHRDLKGDNILMAQEGRCVKIADFGTSKRLKAGALGEAHQTAATTMAGTPLWMAPEVINAGEKKGEKKEAYTFKADVWSVGVVACELLNRGKPPWPAYQTTWQAVFAIGHHEADLPPEIPKEMGPDALDFLRRCFSPDPAKRAPVEELLAHKWLTASEIGAAEPATCIQDIAELRRAYDAAESQRDSTLEDSEFGSGWTPNAMLAGGSPVASLPAAGATCQSELDWTLSGSVGAGRSGELVKGRGRSMRKVASPRAQTARPVTSPGMGTILKDLRQSSAFPRHATAEASAGGLLQADSFRRRSVTGDEVPKHSAGRGLGQTDTIGWGSILSDVAPSPVSPGSGLSTGADRVGQNAPADRTVGGVDRTMGAFGTHVDRTMGTAVDRTMGATMDRTLRDTLIQTVGRTGISASCSIDVPLPQQAASVGRHPPRSPTKHQGRPALDTLLQGQGGPPQSPSLRSPRRVTRKKV
eukprot:TRINITY_DN4155_c0_g1_i3.p1 TRINITY_DN4155_c0_g1~~TRINITY_DN4155_c0_g1_i3.p1  ORF type:complete len:1300 (+),score=164.54 TRINITY_DN4155_c0_g1_i3:461-3901(+)